MKHHQSGGVVGGAAEAAPHLARSDRFGAADPRAAGEAAVTFGLGATPAFDVEFLVAQNRTSHDRLLSMSCSSGPEMGELYLA